MVDLCAWRDEWSQAQTVSVVFTFRYVPSLFVNVGIGIDRVYYVPSVFPLIVSLLYCAMLVLKTTVDPLAAVMKVNSTTGAICGSI